MKAMSIVKYTFTLVGLGMLVGAVYSYTHTRDFLADAVTVKGEVIELVRSRSSDSDTYKPKVRFNTLAGEEITFTSNTGSNPPSYSRGEVVDVYYIEGEPYKAKISGFFSLWGLATILGGMGVVFFGIGGSIVLASILHNRKVTYLKSFGVPIMADIQSVEINRSVKVNGRSPYRIISQWQNPRTSKIHIFNSENIWFDPSDYIDQEQVSVLIKKGNPKKYYVDTSFLPKLAE